MATPLSSYTKIVSPTSLTSKKEPSQKMKHKSQRQPKYVRDFIFFIKSTLIYFKFNTKFKYFALCISFREGKKKAGALSKFSSAEKRGETASQAQSGE